MKWYDKNKSTFGDNENDTQGTNETVETKEETTAPEAMTLNTDNDEFVGAVDTITIEPNVEETGNDSAFIDVVNTVSQGEVIARNTTTIQEESTINGDITTGDDLIIYGKILGNVTSSSNVTVYGNIEGTILCENAVLNNATINGDIDCKGKMDVSEQTIIHGNVKADILMSGGKIKGNIDANDTLCFTATAVTIGDIKCKEFQVEQGACIQGNVTITKHIDL